MISVDSRGGKFNFGGDPTVLAQYNVPKEMFVARFLVSLMQLSLIY
jgi:hypothetical protein